jgi:hypothetical protein
MFGRGFKSLQLHKNLNLCLRLFYISHHFAFNQFVFIFTRMQVGNKNHVFICNLPAKQTDQHPAMLHKPLKPRKALNKAFLKVKPK